MSKANTQHHFLPQMYLKGFAEGGKVDVINRVDGTVRTGQGVDTVARVRGLYSFQNEDGTLNGLLEDEIEKNVETPTKNILDGINTLFPGIPYGTNREVLAQFVALQHLRTPEKLRNSELTFEFMAKLMLRGQTISDEMTAAALERIGVEPTPETIKDIREMAASDNYEISPGKNILLNQMLDLLPRIMFLLLKAYSWNILAFPEPSLITGDHPVVLIPDTSVPHSVYNHGVGFWNAKEIIFPLSSTRLLVLKNGYFPEKVKWASSRQANMANNAIMNSSYLEAYSPPSLTGTYAGHPLGARPVMEVSGGLDPELLKQFNRPPERTHPHRR
jgi:hypothetical protein